MPRLTTHTKAFPVLAEDIKEGARCLGDSEGHPSLFSLPFIYYVLSSFYLPTQSFVCIHLLSTYCVPHIFLERSGIWSLCSRRETGEAKQDRAEEK